MAEAFFRREGKYAGHNELTGEGGYFSPYEVGDEPRYHVMPAYEIRNQIGKEFTISWKANNEGLNDKEFVIPKKGIRIMAIGDSFTEGVGATSDSTFPKQLSSILEDSLSVSVEVWNCGFSASDPVFEFWLFNDKLLKYNPDMVIVSINSTDVNELETRGGFERFGSDSTIHYKEAPWFEPLYAQSFLVRRILHDCFNYTWQLIPAEEEKQIEQVAISNLTSAIDSFTKVCSDKKIQLLIVFHPFLGEIILPKNYRINPLIEYCENNNIAFVDVRKQFHQTGIDSSNAASLFWKLDGHFNNRGYNCLAKSIWKKVGEEICR